MVPTQHHADSNFSFIARRKTVPSQKVPQEGVGNHWFLSRRFAPYWLGQLAWTQRRATGHVWRKFWKYRSLIVDAFVSYEQPVLVYIAPLLLKSNNMMMAANSIAASSSRLDWIWPRSDNFYSRFRAGANHHKHKSKNMMLYISGCRFVAPARFGPSLCYLSQNAVSYCPNILEAS